MTSSEYSEAYLKSSSKALSVTNSFRVKYIKERWREGEEREKEGKSKTL